jgi:hypothetical protein
MIAIAWCGVRRWFVTCLISIHNLIAVEMRVESYIIPEVWYRRQNGSLLHMFATMPRS